jgi:hypothetical protein
MGARVKVIDFKSSWYGFQGYVLDWDWNGEKVVSVKVQFEDNSTADFTENQLKELFD